MIARPAQFEAEEVAQATRGLFDAGTRGGHHRLYGVCTDSRDPLEGALFVALRGERFDGHDFIRAAVDAGAAGLLVSQEGFRKVGARDSVGAEVDVFITEDTLEALGALAGHHRRSLGTPVFAITGSNGKTTTKEMLAAILSVQQHVLATEGNLNNLIGLPLTLLGLQPQHAICVAEMGMNALGEIAAMVAVAEPVLGLVTNVAGAHIGRLGSIENIATAKGEMYRGLDAERAVAIVNFDDFRVRDQADRSGVQQLRSFGTASGSDVRLTAVVASSGHEGQEVHLEVDGENLEVRLPLLGRHNALNAAAAIAAATAVPRFRPSAKEIQQGLLGVQSSQGRLAARRVGDFLLIDDSYNANESSALAAIQTAVELADGRRLVVAFGAMGELGAFSEEAHREVGRALERARAAVVGVFGEGARAVAEVAGATVRFEAEDFDSLLQWLEAELQSGDVILVKGSRSARMERVVRRLEELV